MFRRFTTLLAVVALTFAACGDPAETTTTAAPGETVPPTTAGGTTAPTEPPTAPDPMTFASTRWVVVSFGLDGADDPSLPGNAPTMDFGDDGLSIGGSTGCNTYFGTASFSPETGISFSDLGWTEMACMDEGVMDQEQRFTQALSRIDGFSLSDTSLFLEATDGSAVIRLTPPDPAPDLPLAGAWSLVTFIDEDTAMSVLAGTDVTITIDTVTWEISGNAGCNSYSGSFTATPAEDQRSAAVSVGPVATTLMACEPDIMDQEMMFHAILSGATEMSVEVGFLTILTDDGRALVFEPAEG